MRESSQDGKSLTVGNMDPNRSFFDSEEIENGNAQTTDLLL